MPSCQGKLEPDHSHFDSIFNYSILIVGYRRKFVDSIKNGLTQYAAKARATFKSPNLNNLVLINSAATHFTELSAQ